MARRLLWGGNAQHHPARAGITALCISCGWNSIIENRAVDAANLFFQKLDEQPVTQNIRNKHIYNQKIANVVVEYFEVKTNTEALQPQRPDIKRRVYPPHVCKHTDTQNRDNDMGMSIDNSTEIRNFIYSTRSYMQSLNHPHNFTLFFISKHFYSLLFSTMSFQYVPYIHMYACITPIR